MNTTTDFQRQAKRDKRGLGVILGFAALAIVLAIGGLVLLKAHAAGSIDWPLWAVLTPFGLAVACFAAEMAAMGHYAPRFGR